MAFADGIFKPSQGSSLGMDNSGTGGKVFYYREAETLANISASGYFDSVAAQLDVGDIILIGASDDTNLVAVATKVAGVITVL